MTDRIHCCVPFCENSRPNDNSYPEWICAEHYRAVPRRLRAFKARVQKAYDTAKVQCEAIRQENDDYAREHPGRAHMDIVTRLSVVSRRRQRKQAQLLRTWERCKVAAIEAAGGIG